MLILEYLSGIVEFPDDPPEQRAVRPTEGDYISRMHRRVKARFRELAPDYQWPRAHSFKSLVLMLERLGLVERTGVTEPSEEIIGLESTNPWQDLLQFSGGENTLAEGEYTLSVLTPGEESGQGPEQGHDSAQAIRVRPLWGPVQDSSGPPRP